MKIEKTWYGKYKELVKVAGLGKPDIRYENEIIAPPHNEVVEKIEELVEKAWMYDDLCK